MRAWLSWIAGFGVVLGALLTLFTLYSVAMGSMWLPALFGVGFYGALGFTPRLGPIRLLLSLAFASGSSLLWLWSGSTNLARPHANLLLVFKLAAAAAVAATIAAAITRARSLGKKSPVLGPVFALFALGWIISYLSSGHGSADPMIAWVIRTFGFRPAMAEAMVVGFRKTVHFLFYAVVAATAYANAARNGATRRSCFLAGMSTALIYAVFDELRQSTTPNRQGSGWDVALDMAGASCAMLIAAAWSAGSQPAQGPRAPGPRRERLGTAIRPKKRKK